MSEKKTELQKKNVAKINLFLRYPNSQGRVENKLCSDSYQIKDLEPKQDFWHILNFLMILVFLSLVILIKRIIIKKRRCTLLSQPCLILIPIPQQPDIDIA